MEPNISSPTQLTPGNASSSDDHSQERDYIFLPIELHIRLSLCVLKTIACIAGAAGNICVLIFLKKATKIKTQISATSNLNVFIHSLAISDILVSLNIPFFWIDIFSALFNAGWLCKVRRFVAFLFHLITIYNLVVIGIERYILICRPTSRPLSRATVQKALKGAWVFGFFLTLFVVYSYNGVRIDLLNVSHYTIICRYDYSRVINVAMYQISAVLGYVIPFAIICFTCISVIRVIWKKKFHVSVVEKYVAFALRKWRYKQRKATVLLVVMITAFLAPYCLFVAYATVTMVFNPPTTDFTSNYIVRHTSGLLAHLNGLINFCIHLVQLPGFRMYFKSNMCCIKHKTDALSLKNEHGIQRKRVRIQSPAPGIKDQCSNRRRASIEDIPRSDNCCITSLRRHSI